MRLFLHKWEIALYVIVYVVYLIYGFYKIFSVRDKILNEARFEFAAGWNWIGRPRDDSNDELENFTHYIYNWWPWYVVHVIVSAISRDCLSSKWQSASYAFVSIAALLLTFHRLSVGLIGTLLLSYYFFAKNKVLIWLLAGLWMIVINVVKNSEYFYGQLGYIEYYLLIVTLSWSLLRCCSFKLTRVNDKDANAKNKHQFEPQHFIGYTLYFPCLVFGPFLSYSRYSTTLKKHSTPQLPSRQKFLKLGTDLLRVAFWWCVLQLALHFLYIHYMTRDASIVAFIQPEFSQHAIGYFLGQFFFLYYVVTYGLGIAYAHFDELNPPNRPRCIGCIHFYSDMWKYFDQGLYEFLLNHIYFELCNKNSMLLRRILATAATFTFVFVWHGCYTYVLIWSALNFGSLIAEKCFRAMLSSKFYTKWATKYLNPEDFMRLRALLATQLFIPAAFSNVYFIGGKDVGDHLMRNAYLGGLENYLKLSFCSYCFFQCSEVILMLRKTKIK